MLRNQLWRIVWHSIEYHTHFAVKSRSREQLGEPPERDEGENGVSPKVQFPDGAVVLCAPNRHSCCHGIRHGDMGRRSVTTGVTVGKNP
ncbi:hypothetical protein AVEN_114276-1 [Araneus ventricosus]|uniref:Uncharacterized protein n=1 Tax=Araneus ventricosus TaxID=182803 RepID=A0A4Y2G187_ARAVE|nr:hypothetical protein AVEN_114276-1 [Araneus ventricosus]